MRDLLPKPFVVVPVCIETDEDGYCGYSPALDGCVVGGDTKDEVLANLQEAVRLFLASYIKNNEELPAGCIRSCGIPVSDALGVHGYSHGELLPGVQTTAPEDCERSDLVVAL